MTLRASFLLVGLVFLAGLGRLPRADLSLAQGNRLPHTAILFGDSAQSPDAQWTLSALASDAGRLSDIYDLGTEDGGRYRWVCAFDLTGTRVVGTVIDVYVYSTNDPWGRPGLSGDMNALDMSSMRLLGHVVVQHAIDPDPVFGVGVVTLHARYVQLGAINKTTLPFKATHTGHYCALIRAE